MLGIMQNVSVVTVLTLSITAILYVLPDVLVTLMQSVRSGLNSNVDTLK